MLFSFLYIYKKKGLFGASPASILEGSKEEEKRERITYFN